MNSRKLESKSSIYFTALFSAVKFPISSLAEFFYFLTFFIFYFLHFLFPVSFATSAETGTLENAEAWLRFDELFLQVGADALLVNCKKTRNDHVGNERHSKPSHQCNHGLELSKNEVSQALLLP